MDSRHKGKVGMTKKNHAYDSRYEMHIYWSQRKRPNIYVSRGAAEASIIYGEIMHNGIEQRNSIQRGNM